MSEEDRLKLENELLLTKSKAQMINLYLDLQQKVEQLEKELQTTANNCKQLENIRKEENFTGTKGYYKGKEIWCMEYSDEEDKYKNSLRFLKDTLDQLLEENNNGK